MSLQPVQIVEYLPTAVWIENDLFGSRSVMLQHQGMHPFAYATFHYDYAYTSNAGAVNAAESLARSLGATDPIEHRQRATIEPPAATNHPLNIK